MMHPDMSQFLHFVAAKRPDERYEFEAARACACGQFADSLGIPDGQWMCTSRYGNFWQQANALASIRPRNFGALARRVSAHIVAMQNA